MSTRQKSAPDTSKPLLAAPTVTKGQTLVTIAAGQHYIVIEPLRAAKGYQLTETKRAEPSQAKTTMVVTTMTSRQRDAVISQVRKGATLWDALTAALGAISDATSAARSMGLKGGPRRSELLGPVRTREIAERAAAARWAKYRATKAQDDEA